MDWLYGTLAALCFITAVSILPFGVSSTPFGPPGLIPAVKWTAVGLGLIGAAFTGACIGA